MFSRCLVGGLVVSVMFICQGCMGGEPGRVPLKNGGELTCTTEGSAKCEGSDDKGPCNQEWLTKAAATCCSGGVVAMKFPDLSQEEGQKKCLAQMVEGGEKDAKANGKVDKDGEGEAGKKEGGEGEVEAGKKEIEAGKSMVEEGRKEEGGEAGDEQLPEAAPNVEAPKTSALEESSRTTRGSSQGTLTQDAVHAKGASSKTIIVQEVDSKGATSTKNVIEEHYTPQVSRNVAKDHLNARQGSGTDIHEQ